MMVVVAFPIQSTGADRFHPTDAEIVSIGRPSIVPLPSLRLALGSPSTARPPASTAFSLLRVPRPPLQDLPHRIDHPPPPLLRQTPGRIGLPLHLVRLRLRRVDHIRTRLQLQRETVADLSIGVRLVLERLVPVRQEGLDPRFGVFDVGRLEVEGAQIGIRDGVSGELQHGGIDLGPVDGGIALQVDDPHGLQIRRPHEGIGPRRNRRAVRSLRVSVRRDRPLLPIGRAHVEHGVVVASQPVPRRRRRSRHPHRKMGQAGVKGRSPRRAGAIVLQPLPHRQIQRVLVQVLKRRTRRHGPVLSARVMGIDPPAAPPFLALHSLLVHPRTGLEVIQERVGHDAAPALLPDVLLVPLGEPAALGAQEGHHLGGARRGRFDGAGRVEVGEPRVRFDGGGGAGQEGALGVLGGLVDLGGEALFGGHAEALFLFMS
mmetsp:Transcript_10475/g.22413  ORF Transcript_10475/g.22413 Transcript_10475/m.22413 type:complete len:430 (+) Transcript_10475:1415-2704(+)